MDNNQLVLFHLLNLVDHAKNTYDLYYKGYQRPSLICGCCSSIYHHFKTLFEHQRRVDVIDSHIDVIIEQPVENDYELL